jgi:8-oxo-dGTP pyrophosphatase MutT (NUDIX family)
MESDFSLDERTLSFLVRDGMVSLGERLDAMGNTNVGKGKLNGYGGKLKLPNRLYTTPIYRKYIEYPESGALRELWEEARVVVKPEHLESRGIISFYWPQVLKELNQTVHIYVCRSCPDDPLKTHEMRPEWHSVTNMPWDRMFPADPFWLKHVLIGDIAVIGHVYYNADKTLREQPDIRDYKTGKKLEPWDY